MDIVVPFHGHYQHVRDLIGGIYLSCASIPFTIIIADDCSPNSLFYESLTKYDVKLKAVRLDAHRGFGAALNAGIRAGTNPYLALVNSDCRVEEHGWLRELGRALDSTRGVGMVSAVSNHGGTSKLIERNRFDRGDRTLVVAEPLPLVCAIMKRKVYERAGPFAEYPYGWYEDEEYAHRLSRLGLRQAVCEKAYIGHEGGLTTQTLWAKSPEVKTVMEDNRNRCVAAIR